jgi:hypothetical protein
MALLGNLVGTVDGLVGGLIGAGAGASSDTSLQVATNPTVDLSASDVLQAAQVTCCKPRSAVATAASSPTSVWAASVISACT